MGQERLGPSYFFISIVLGPLNNGREREREREGGRERGRGEVSAI